MLFTSKNCLLSDFIYKKYCSRKWVRERGEGRGWLAAPYSVYDHETLLVEFLLSRQYDQPKTECKTYPHLFVYTSLCVKKGFRSTTVSSQSVC